MSHDDWRLLRYGIVLAIIGFFIVWKIESRSLAEAAFGAVAIALYLYSKRRGRDDKISIDDEEGNHQSANNGQFTDKIEKHS